MLGCFSQSASELDRESATEKDLWYLETSVCGIFSLQNALLFTNFGSTGRLHYFSAVHIVRAHASYMDVICHFCMEFHLGSENISRGTIQHLNCTNCKFECDHFNIVGDSWAMNFLGVIGLTNLSSSEIFITHLTKREFQRYSELEQSEVENRISDLVNRKELLYLKREKDDNNKLFIPCPKCHSKMEPINEISLADYVLKGGKIYTIGNYPND